MNKTIIININGIVFHIEEDAYETLKSYMTEVKRHFAYSSDSHEIVTDIENRLAEMFSERLATQNKEVIILADVTDVTDQMGKPSAFDSESEEVDFGTDRIKQSRTLYKDPDDRKIAGVCAGLGHYLGIEAKWIRLITILLTLFSGVGIVPYVILWIILPTANTRQEKMAMKGEPINLQSFKRNFDEETETVRTTTAGSSGEFVHAAKGSDPVHEIVNFIGNALKLIIKAIGVFIISIGAIVLFGLIIALVFGLGFLNDSDFQQFPLNILTPELQSPVFFSAFLLLIIPLLALILFAIRVILNRKVISRYGSFAMLILWLTGIAMGAYYGSKVAAEFKEEAKLEQVETLKSYPSLQLELNPDMFFGKEDSLRYKIDTDEVSGRIIRAKSDFEENTQKFDLFIEKSDDSTLVLIKELGARGNDFEEALQAAKRIRYQAVQKDSKILFDEYFSLAGNGLYRAQELDVHLKVPVNTRITIDGKLSRNLRGYNLWYCQPDKADWDATSEWMMTEDGLKCVDEELYLRKKER